MRKNEHLMSDKLFNINSEHLAILASLSGKISGLSTSLQARTEIDQKTVMAQQLWIACSGMEKTAAPEDSFV